MNENNLLNLIGNVFSNTGSKYLSSWCFDWFFGCCRWFRGRNCGIHFFFLSFSFIFSFTFEFQLKTKKYFTLKFMFRMKYKTYLCINFNVRINKYNGIFNYNITLWSIFLIRWNRFHCTQCFHTTNNSRKKNLIEVLYY